MEKFLKETDAMMEAGKKCLSDPDIPVSLKEWVRLEMENHQHCMESFISKISDEVRVKAERRGFGRSSK